VPAVPHVGMGVLLRAFHPKGLGPSVSKLLAHTCTCAHTASDAVTKFCTVVKVDDGKLLEGRQRPVLWPKIL